MYMTALKEKKIKSIVEKLEKCWFKEQWKPVRTKFVKTLNSL